MKAIAIINEMPRYCLECPMHDISSMDGDWLCLPAGGRWIENQNEQRDNYLVHKPNWCPLKPIPSEACEMLVKGLDAMEKMKAVEVKVVRRTE